MPLGMMLSGLILSPEVIFMHVNLNLNSLPVLKSDTHGIFSLGAASKKLCKCSVLEKYFTDLIENKSS